MEVSVEAGGPDRLNSPPKQAQAAPAAPSENVLQLQKRVAGVLPIAVDVLHAGTAFHFVRALVMNEETKVTFAYKSRG